jgi:DNA-binding winged helix-turn-helix (wHTH) protein
MNIIKLSPKEKHPVHFELDLRTGVLSSSDGTRKTLGSTEFAILDRLAREPRGPVSTEELLDEGWKHPNRKLESVAKTVSDLRQKLSDSEPKKRYIATIPNFGYELIAKCDRLESSGMPPDNMPDGRRPEVKDVHPLPPAPKPTAYTQGDWITAALVAPDRAEDELKRIATVVRHEAPSSDHPNLCILGFIDERIHELLAKHAAGGASEADRAEACIAKVVSDLLEQQKSSFIWNLDESEGGDPVTVFRNTVKEFVQSRKSGNGRGQERVGASHPSTVPDGISRTDGKAPNEPKRSIEAELNAFKTSFAVADLSDYFDMLLDGEDIICKVSGEERYKSLHIAVMPIQLAQAEAAVAEEKGDLAASQQHRKMAEIQLASLKRRIAGITDLS